MCSKINFSITPNKVLQPVCVFTPWGEVLLTCSPVCRVWIGPDCPSLWWWCPLMCPILQHLLAPPAGWRCTAAGGAIARCTVVTAWDTLLQTPASGMTRLKRDRGKIMRQSLLWMIGLRKAITEGSQKEWINSYFLTTLTEIMTRFYTITSDKYWHSNLSEQMWINTFKKVLFQLITNYRRTDGLMEYKLYL